MHSSVLLHLNGMRHGAQVVDFGVEWARRSNARVRGVTLSDTRKLAAMAAAGESPFSTLGESVRLEEFERGREAVQARLTQACLAARVDFDVRRGQGSPMEVLPAEAQFHDLVVTSHSTAAEDLDPSFEETSADDLYSLLLQGVHPLLVLRGAERPPQRVLLVLDGTPSSVRSVRTFMGQNLLPDAELRLLAVADDEPLARRLLRETLDLPRCRSTRMETGILTGPPRKTVAPYVLKWEAELVVLGVARGNALARRLLGTPALDVLKKTDAALYAAA